jgi:hypothetical protein
VFDITLIGCVRQRCGTLCFKSAEIVIVHVHCQPLAVIFGKQATILPNKCSNGKQAIDLRHPDATDMITRLIHLSMRGRRLVPLLCAGYLGRVPFVAHPGVPCVRALIPHDQEPDASSTD